MSGFAEYGDYDALGLAKLVRDGEVSARELVDETIERIERYNPRLNAVVHKMYEHARALADAHDSRSASNDAGDAPFAGVPFLLKDLLAAYKGQPMSFGSRAMRGYIPRYDSEMVKRFKRAGVITVGKTNLSELGVAPFTEPKAFGPACNPWDTTRTPSGSSGGAAIVVAARIVPMASGGDGGGSIRTPASACGVFGLKPSRGRNPVGPSCGEIWQGVVAEHVLTRSVRDSAAMLDASAGPDIGALYHAPPPARPFVDEVTADPGRLTIAYTTESLLGSHVDRACVDGVERTVRLLRELGHEVVPAKPKLQRRAFLRAYIIMVAVETAAELEHMATLLGVKRLPPGHVELETRTLALVGRKAGSMGLARARRVLHQAARDLGEFMHPYDAFLTPTLAKPPIPIGTLRPNAAELAAMRVLEFARASNLMTALGAIDRLTDKVFGYSAYCPVFNVSGQPAVSMPLHWTDDGLPVGMHFAARYADEATLFRLAGQLERAQPWIGRKPPVCA